MERSDTYFGDCKSPYSRPADCKSAGTGYSIDAIIGAAGAFCPELFGLPATLWFFGGKQVTYCYGSNVITPMIQNGINPGLMIYQPFK